MWWVSPSSRKDAQLTKQQLHSSVSNNADDTAVDDDENDDMTTSSTSSTEDNMSDVEVSHDLQQQQQKHCRCDDLPYLFSLCRRWAWDDIVRRCQTHPHEAASFADDGASVDCNGDTALHLILCGQPPAEPVRALLRACPQLARVRNKAGYLPLSVACCYRPIGSVIRALVQAYPMALSEGVTSGSTPLDLLCEYGCQPDALLVVLQTQEGVEALLQRHYQQHHQQEGRASTRTRIPPLEILHRCRNNIDFSLALQTMRLMRARQRLLPKNRQNNNKNAEDFCHRVDDLVQAFASNIYWEKARLLLLALHLQRALPLWTGLDNNNSSDNDDSQFLHAAIANPNCPVELQEFAILLHQNEMMVPFSDGTCEKSFGRLPLHVAVAASSSSSSGGGGHGQNSNNSSELVRHILEANPAAAFERDMEGSLPLTLAVQNTTSTSYMSGTCLGALIQANPDAARELFDSLESASLYPYYLMRLSSAHPEALFQILQSNPDIL